MSDNMKLMAETRDRVGKGASRALRREGRVPAVLYGNKQEPLGIHVEARALVKLLGTGHFMNSLVMIDTGDGKPVRTIPKDVPLDAVSDRPIHVDFLRIDEHAKLNIDIPVVFTGEEESPGLTRGGVLNIVRHELELVVDAASIPDQIEISLEGLDIGDSIHISMVDLPAGSESAVTDRDFTIATLVAPSALKSEEEEEEEAAAEGEEGEEGEGETEVTEQSADTVMGEEPGDQKA